MNGAAAPMQAWIEDAGRVHSAGAQGSGDPGEPAFTIGPCVRPRSMRPATDFARVRSVGYPGACRRVQAILLETIFRRLQEALDVWPAQASRRETPDCPRSLG